MVTLLEASARSSSKFIPQRMRIEKLSKSKEGENIVSFSCLLGIYGRHINNILYSFITVNSQNRIELG